MIINALNSGAKVFMADCEDSNAPTWDNDRAGQGNLRDAVAADRLRHEPEGKAYRLNPVTATLIVRPRGWHLDEAHVELDGKPVSGSLRRFRALPVPQRPRADRAWQRAVLLPAQAGKPSRGAACGLVIDHAETRLGLPRGSIKVTVLIETLLAAFEMDEILYELREHIVGLNCGRWDYIFSYIKHLPADASRVLPDRGQVTMTKLPARLLAAADPHLPPPRRLRDGRHGRADPDQGTIRKPTTRRSPRCAPTRSARPATATMAPGSPIRAWCPMAMEIFDRHMPEANQLARQREDVSVSART
jgi:malate synthase